MWGCPVYSLKTDKEIPKIGARGHIGFNLGRDPMTKDAYYIYIPGTKHVLTRRDLIFDEGWIARSQRLPQTIHQTYDYDLHPTQINFPLNQEQITTTDFDTTNNSTTTDHTHGPDSANTDANNLLHFSHEPDTDADPASDSDFDLADHHVITPENDKFGYTRILEQRPNNTFLVQWPDTLNITQAGIDNRLNTEPVPYEIVHKEQRSDGNFNVSWKQTVEPFDALEPAHVSKFLAAQPDSPPSHTGLITQIENTYYAFIDIHDTPTSFSEVFHSIDKNKWIQAMDKEIEGLNNAHTWTLVPETEALNIITGKWVFKIKYSNGQLQKYKARYCARGFTQKKGIDYDEIFSPVARGSTINSILTLANQRKDLIHIMDIGNAFVQTPVKDGTKLYVSQPQGYEIYGPKKQKLVCQLNTYLYGLLQASREFNRYLKAILVKQLKFRQTASDTCLFVKDTSDDKRRMIVATYVDDLIVIATHQSDMDTFLQTLRKTFPVTVNDLLTDAQILGISISYNRNEGILNLHQKHTIEAALKKFEFDQLTKASTPFEENWHPDLHRTTDSTIVDKFPIRETIGTLNDIQIHTRPDIAYAVSRCQREMHKPTYSLVVAIKRIFRYLIGTLDFHLISHRNPSIKSLAPTDILTSYSDANWGVYDHDLQYTMKSTSGHIHFLFNTPISWAVKVQQGKPAQSSGESEYIGTYHCLQEDVHLINILSELGVTVKTPQDTKIIAYTDSESCIGMSKNPVNHKRNKHIMLKYHYIRHMIEDDEAQLRKVRAADNPADLFTKAIRTVKLFHHLRNIIFQADISKR